MKIAAFATLDAVLRTGSFAGAAKESNVTPSAVSMQMKQLEQYLGKQLFDRSGLQVRPTPAAREVAEVMRAPLRQLDALRRSASLAVEGHLRVGIIESLQPLVLPPVLRMLREQHPRLVLRPSRGRSIAMTSAVKAGELDAAFAAQLSRGGPGVLQWEPMLRRELVLVAPPGTSEKTVVSLFRRYDWIRYDRDTATGALAARFVSRHVGDHRSAIEIDSASTIVAMVSAGLGIAIVQAPDAIQMANHPVRVVRLGRQAPVLQLCLVTRRSDADSRGLAALREAMQAALATL